MDHGILHQKFCNFGVRGKLLTLLTSYFSGRKQNIKVRISRLKYKVSRLKVDDAKNQRLLERVETSEVAHHSSTREI